MPQFIPQEEFFSGAGGEVDECAITLRFYGDDLEPEAITALLGVQPTDCCRKGDPVRGSRTGRWLLDFEHTTDIADNQIRLLFSDLPAELSIWRQLARQFSAGIMCCLFIKQWNRGTTFCAQTIADVAARGLKLDVDIYTPLQQYDNPSGPLKFSGGPGD